MSICACEFADGRGAEEERERGREGARPAGGTNYICCCREGCCGYFCSRSAVASGCAVKEKEKGMSWINDTSQKDPTSNVGWADLMCDGCRIEAQLTLTGLFLLRTFPMKMFSAAAA